MQEEWEDWQEDDDDFEEEDAMSPIPSHLYSVFEDGPFSTCSICDGLFTDEEGDRLYEIKKVYRGQNVIFECAICHQCGQNLLKEYSHESIENIKGYFEDHFKPGLTLLECHFCGKSRNPETDATSIMAVCIGAYLVQQPVCMCDPCTEAINETLSKKTREVNGDFIRDYFPGIPAEWQDSPIMHL